MFDDDIDWMNAASDCGLVALCREMAVLARPFERDQPKPPGRRRLRRNVAYSGVARPSRAAHGLLHHS